ncbi:MAG: hemin uptake protein HemP [Gemmataceae bacterium]
MKFETNWLSSENTDQISIDTKELFGDRVAILIRHGHAEYELKITRRKRLILTKKSGEEDG